MSAREIAEHRRTLPKGHVREQNTAHTVGLDPVEADGDSVTVSTPAVQQIAQAMPPREVAQDIYGMIWNWAKGDRKNFALMAQIVRNSYPDAYGHLSDDELASKIEQHARDAARAATEEVYSDRWDRGNNVDMWLGRPAMP
jgi:hypothetical protein